MRRLFKDQAWCKCLDVMVFGDTFVCNILCFYINTQRVCYFYVDKYIKNNITETICSVINVNIFNRKWQYFIVPRFRRLIRIEW